MHECHLIFKSLFPDSQSVQLSLAPINPRQGQQSGCFHISNFKSTTAASQSSPISLPSAPPVILIQPIVSTDHPIPYSYQNSSNHVVTHRRSQRRFDRWAAPTRRGRSSRTQQSRPNIETGVRYNCPRTISPSSIS